MNMFEECFPKKAITFITAGLMFNILYKYTPIDVIAASHNKARPDLNLYTQAIKNRRKIRVIVLILPPPRRFLTTWFRENCSVLNIGFNNTSSIPHTNDNI